MPTNDVIDVLSEATDDLPLHPFHNDIQAIRISRRIGQWEASCGPKPTPVRF